MMQISAAVLNEMAAHFHAIAQSKGFYDLHNEVILNENLSAADRQSLDRALLQASIARMHSELSEAVEAVRHGNPESEKIPGFSHLEEEFADLLIRVLDCCGFYQLNIGEAVVAKSEYNLNRPYLHGKNS
jgi:NTP pyrophosphatase (non-canonical NTP hydrolase)